MFLEEALDCVAISQGQQQQPGQQLTSRPPKSSMDASSTTTTKQTPPPQRRVIIRQAQEPQPNQAGTTNTPPKANSSISSNDKASPVTTPSPTGVMRHHRDTTTRQQHSPQQQSPTQTMTEEELLSLLCQPLSDLERRHQQQQDEEEDDPSSEFWMDSEYAAKRDEIWACLNGDDNNNTTEEEVDLWKLRSLALTKGGYLCPDVRKRVWPKLFAVHQQVLSLSLSSSLSPSPSFSGEDGDNNETGSEQQQQQQVRKLKRDVSRSLWKVQKIMLLSQKYAKQQQAQLDAALEEHKQREQQQSAAAAKTPTTTKHHHYSQTDQQHEEPSVQSLDSDDSPQSPPTPLISNHNKNNKRSTHRLNPPLTKIPYPHGDEDDDDHDEENDESHNGSMHSSSTLVASNVSLDPHSGFPYSNTVAKRGRKSTLHEKTILYNILSHEQDSYFAGLSDLVAVGLMNLESPSLTRLMLQRLVTHHLHPWLAKPSSPSSSSGDSSRSIENDTKTRASAAVCALLRLVDPELFGCLENELETVGKIGVWWASTWFAQDILSATLVSRLMDLFLVSHPAMPMYIAVAIFSIHRTVLLRVFSPKTPLGSLPQGLSMLHVLECITHQSLSRQLPRAQAQWRLEAIVQRATRYMQQIPPLQILGDLDRGAPAWQSLSTAPTDVSLLQQLATPERRRKNSGVLETTTTTEALVEADEEETKVLDTSNNNGITTPTRLAPAVDKGSVIVTSELPPPSVAWIWILAVLSLLSVYMLGKWVGRVGEGPNLSSVMATLRQQKMLEEEPFGSSSRWITRVHARPPDLPLSTAAETEGSIMSEKEETDYESMAPAAPLSAADADMETQVDDGQNAINEMTPDGETDEVTTNADEDLGETQNDDLRYQSGDASSNQGNGAEGDENGQNDSKDEESSDSDIPAGVNTFIDPETEESINDLQALVHDLAAGGVVVGMSNNTSDSSWLLEPLVLRSWLHPLDREIQFDSLQQPEEDVGKESESLGTEPVSEPDDSPDDAAPLSGETVSELDDSQEADARLSGETVLESGSDLAAGNSDPIPVPATNDEADKLFDSAEAETKFHLSEDPLVEQVEAFDVSTVVDCNDDSACTLKTPGPLQMAKDGLVLPLDLSTTRNLAEKWKDPELYVKEGTQEMIQKESIPITERSILKRPIQAARALFSTSFPLSWFVLMVL